MKTNIDNLLSDLYELEGLLLVMQRHIDDVPQVVIDRFKEKVALVTSQAAIITEHATIVEDKISDNTPQQPTLKKDEKCDIKTNAPQPPVFKPETINKVEVQQTAVIEKCQEHPAKEPQPMVSKQPTQPAEKSGHDITEAFSINDRYLFQRELFNGDNAKFNEAIVAMQGKDNLDQMLQYMTDELQWDTSDDIVREFVRLINKSLKK